VCWAMCCCGYWVEGKAQRGVQGAGLGGEGGRQEGERPTVVPSTS
jgi:hypothetical protein